MPVEPVLTLILFAVVANLVEEILIKHQGHTSVGLVGMQWFMQVLTDAGCADVATCQYDPRRVSDMHNELVGPDRRRRFDSPR